MAWRLGKAVDEGVEIERGVRDLMDSEPPQDCNQKVALGAPDDVVDPE